jgi:hypothetical protein
LRSRCAGYYLGRIRNEKKRVERRARDGKEGGMGRGMRKGMDGMIGVREGDDWGQGRGRAGRKEEGDGQDRVKADWRSVKVLLPTWKGRDASPEFVMGSAGVPPRAPVNVWISVSFEISA